MASRADKPGEYFRRPVWAKSFEQSSEMTEDNSVDISRKDLDDDEPVVDESTRESHREKEKRPSRLNPQQKSLRTGHRHRKRWRYS